LPARQSTGSPNPGKKSRKVNQDCTICVSCQSDDTRLHRPVTAGKPDRLAGIPVRWKPSPGGQLKHLLQDPHPSASVQRCNIAVLRARIESRTPFCFSPRLPLVELGLLHITQGASNPSACSKSLVPFIAVPFRPLPLASDPTEPRDPYYPLAPGEEQNETVAGRSIMCSAVPAPLPWEKAGRV